MEDTVHPRVFVFSIIIGALLLLLVIGAFVQAKNRTGTIVLPGGSTYLGPTPTQQHTTVTPPASGKITIPSDAAWTERTGVQFPYTFTYPDTLSLGVFPNDPYDAVTIFHPGTDANANIFFRVENLTTLNKSEYAGKTEAYAKVWWKDYAWKNVSSVSAFTNKNGLKGYRALYVNDLGKSPYEHVFFEVPNNPNLVIWISGKLFDTSVFNRLVDSVNWK